MKKSELFVILVVGAAITRRSCGCGVHGSRRGEEKEEEEEEKKSKKKNKKQEQAQEQGGKHNKCFVWFHALLAPLSGRVASPAQLTHHG